MMYSQEERRRIAELMLELERQPTAQRPAPGMQARFITLQEWAKLNFSKVPHDNTLLRWVSQGHIQPQPQKIGRIWRVKHDAVYKAN
ncbi:MULTISPECIES: excisionase [unclassified Duganella]|uniref:excisionase n=1 Tax=unclassified Duganella TaxID=2636909 RepID=UPI000881ACE2|nr:MULTISPECIES: excisionase [unclassified Duganella]SDF79264.1 Excisionase-like protein [Duganella sp. OV458]SDI49868.1 Excisionase-like protein [Duganella sp. OV510]